MVSRPALLAKHLPIPQALQTSGIVNRDIGRCLVNKTVSFLPIEEGVRGILETRGCEQMG